MHCTSLFPCAGARKWLQRSCQKGAYIHVSRFKNAVRNTKVVVCFRLNSQQQLADAGSLRWANEIRGRLASRTGGVSLVRGLQVDLRIIRLAEILEGWCVSRDGILPNRGVHLLGRFAAPAAKCTAKVVSGIW